MVYILFILNLKRRYLSYYGLCSFVCVKIIYYNYWLYNIMCKFIGKNDFVYFYECINKLDNLF